MALVLTRRAGERILIGDLIVVQVAHIGPTSCRLAIEPGNPASVELQAGGDEAEIDPGIYIELKGCNGNQARLAIEAPRNVRVDREEVRRQIEAQQQGGAS